MKSHRWILLVILALLPTASLSAQLAIDPKVEARVDSLLALMTLDEKVGQLVQCAGRFEGSAEHPTLHPDLKILIRRGQTGSLLNVVGASLTREVQQLAVEESRLRIPLLFGLDVIHGFRTTFPIPLASACTWDPDLIARAEGVAAMEASVAGVHWTFAPMVDIARDPRWGRIAEGAGEDPFLGSVIAAARVRGFQGSGLGSEGSLMACPKHFAAYGGAEAGRDYNTVDISDRTLRTVYLPPFKAAVDAGAGSLMCSFNEISGTPSSSNRRLLTEILRNEWKFTGLVVSDWNSIGELIPHGVAGDPKQAATLALKAGVDIDMESNCYSKELAAAVAEGIVSQAELNEAVRRVLRMKFKLGLFEHPFRTCDPENERRAMLTSDHRTLAREVARRSIVLLKNEGFLLPLSKNMGTLAVIGPLADDRKDPLGPWKAFGEPKDVVTLLEGIKSAVSPSTKILYAQGCTIQDSLGQGIGNAVAMAKTADAVVVAVGESIEMSGEAASRTNLGLPGKQMDLVSALVQTGKPVVVVLMNGRPLVITDLATTAPAILETWFLGIEAGHAIADVLFGDANPSGKLTTTFPRSVGQVPVYYNHKNTGRPANSSDHYTSKYIDSPIHPLYPFGYGLSYTSFRYDNLSINKKEFRDGENLDVTVSVRNVGNRPGREVVQLYVRDVVSSVTRPVMELKGFAAVSLLPGETKTVHLALPPDSFRFYNESMKWVAEPGAFEVMVGPNSDEVLKISVTMVR